MIAALTNSKACPASGISSPSPLHERHRRSGWFRDAESNKGYALCKTAGHITFGLLSGRVRPGESKFLQGVPCTIYRAHDDLLLLAAPFLDPPGS